MSYEIFIKFYNSSTKFTLIILVEKKNVKPKKKIY